MIRKNHILLALVLSFSASAHALVGGPFDNGDYSQLLDNSAIYQATFTMSNGIGFAQFGSNVSLGPTITASSSGSSSATNNSIGTILDRSVIYYKGVTYFGMATGMVDMTRKSIMGITNGSPNATLQQSTSVAVAGTTAAGALNALSTVVSNPGLSFTCNTEWSGTITESSSLLNFDGSGQLTILNPDLGTQIYAAIASLVGAIPQAASSSSSGGGGTTSVATLIAGIRSLATLLTDPTIASAPIPSADTVAQNSETVDMHVTGSRKFFLSSR